MTPSILLAVVLAGGALAVHLHKLWRRERDDKEQIHLSQYFRRGNPPGGEP